MPFEFALPESLRKQGWKAKIRERERLEPPHVTIIRKTKTWRFCLRSARFLDRSPPRGDVPSALVAQVVAGLEQLRTAWDAMYPENPVGEDR